MLFLKTEKWWEKFKEISSRLIVEAPFCASEYRRGIIDWVPSGRSRYGQARKWKKHITPEAWKGDSDLLEICWIFGDF